MPNPVSRAVRAVPRETALVVTLVSGSHVVHHMYLVLLPPLVGVLTLEFGVTVGAVGLAMGAVGLTNTTFQLPFGYLADTYDRAWTLGLSLGFGALGTAIIALSPDLGWVVVGQLVLGVGVAGHHPAHYPLLADATPVDHRGRAFSVHGFAGNVGFALPPALVAVALGVPWLTWRHAVGLVAVVGAIFTAVAVVVLARHVDDSVTMPPDPGADTDVPVRERVAERLRSLAASRLVLALALLALVSATASWGVTSYVAVLLTDGYGVPLEVANLVLTGMFVAGALGVLVGGELADRVAAGPVILASFAVVTVAVATLASLALSAVVAIAVVLVVGAARTAGAPARSKLADAVSARGDLGQNFAVITVGIMLGGAIAPPVFGAIIDRAGPQAAFVGVAAVGLAATLLTVAILATYREEFGRSPTASATDD